MQRSRRAEDSASYHDEVAVNGFVQTMSLLNGAGEILGRVILQIWRTYGAGEFPEITPHWKEGQPSRRDGMAIHAKPGVGTPGYFPGALWGHVSREVIAGEIARRIGTDESPLQGW